MDEKCVLEGGRDEGVVERTVKEVYWVFLFA